MRKNKSFSSGWRHSVITSDTLITLSPTPGCQLQGDLLDYEHQTISLFLVMFQDLGETVAGVSDRHNVFCGQLLWKTQSQCIKIKISPPNNSTSGPTKCSVGVPRCVWPAGTGGGWRMVEGPDGVWRRTGGWGPQCLASSHRRHTRGPTWSPYVLGAKKILHLLSCDTNEKSS